MNASIRLACLAVGFTVSWVATSAHAEVIRFEGAITERPCEVGIERVSWAGIGQGVQVSLSECASVPSITPTQVGSNLIYPTLALTESQWFIALDEPGRLVRLTLTYP